MRRFVVIVLDGFGIGAMDDAKIVRPGDEKANTLGSILRDHPGSEASGSGEAGADERLWQREQLYEVFS